MSGLTPPRLKNDCFALPPGVDWTPVDDALARLKDRLTCVVKVEQVPFSQASSRILAKPAVAMRANPPAANSAVDGYGFAHAATGAGDQLLPLVQGRAAAGAPHQDAVPHGSAIRILTGALLPEGVDTVVLEEDTSTDGERIAFEGPIRAGANTRKAGEDVKAGDVVAEKGTRIGPAEMALLSATGVTHVQTYAPLRVGVLSTGDEIADPNTALDQRQQHGAVCVIGFCWI
ncbi:MAG: molybdopterin molybdenumtransferase MoeA, partial [Pseudomonadota bacterium]